MLNFKSALDDLIGSICHQSAVDLFPNELKYLFTCVREHVKLQLVKKAAAASGLSAAANGVTDEKLVRIYCVSAFVFLRLLCPAMLNPKSFGLKFYQNTQNSVSSADSSSNIEGKISNAESASSLATANNLLDYADLAVQFSVFSPNFMFSLSATSPLSNQSNSFQASCSIQTTTASINTYPYSTQQPFNYSNSPAPSNATY